MLEQLRAVQAEAQERYPDMDWDPYNEEPVDDYGYGETARLGFIAGRTVSAEQVAMIADPIWDQLVGVAKSAMRDEIAQNLRAAGFYVEGDDHE